MLNGIINKNIINFFKENKIGNPPWNYYFLQNLEEKEYPRYLAKLFKLNTGENLPLKYDFKTKGWVINKKRCKTFNQKIQWIKLYGVTDLMRRCTDKVAVRDYVAEKIGSEYLKPVLQIIPTPIVTCSHSEHGVNLGAKNLDQMEKKSMPSPCDTSAPNICQPQYDGKLNDVSTYFDQIQWDKLPNSFVIKCNHGCKWHYIIKNKEQFLNTPQLFETVKRNITGWLEQEYWCWGGFEMQYQGIEPKILIEPLMRDEINTEPIKINVYCFSGSPRLIIKLHNDREVTVWDEYLNYIEDISSAYDIKIYNKADNIIHQIFDLSNKLIKDFIFIRIDWMIYNNTPFFEEFTFTPYSGFNRISKRLNNLIIK